jgi:hypothetical protein
MYATLVTVDIHGSREVTEKLLRDSLSRGRSRSTVSCEARGFGQMTEQAVVASSSGKAKNMRSRPRRDPARSTSWRSRHDAKR